MRFPGSYQRYHEVFGLTRFAPALAVPIHKTVRAGLVVIVVPVLAIPLIFLSRRIAAAAAIHVACSSGAWPIIIVVPKGAVLIVLGLSWRRTGVTPAWPTTNSVLAALGIVAERFIFVSWSADTPITVKPQGFTRGIAASVLQCLPGASTVGSRISVSKGRENAKESEQGQKCLHDVYP